MFGDQLYGFNAFHQALDPPDAAETTLPIRRPVALVLLAARLKNLALTPLSERSAKISQHPQSNKIHADKRLPTRHNPRPADRFHIELLPCQQTQPAAKVNVSKSDVEGAHEAEKHGSAKHKPFALKKFKKPSCSPCFHFGGQDFLSTSRN